MKTILVLFVLLLPSMAWAEETIFFNTDRNRFEYADGRVVPHHRLETGKDYPQLRAGEMQCTLMNCISDQDQREWDKQQLDRALRAERDCTDKMEAAMKAMDKVILSGRLPPESDAGYHDLVEALILWIPVKRDCWRATGSPGTP